MMKAVFGWLLILIILAGLILYVYNTTGGGKPAATLSQPAQNATGLPLEKPPEFTLDIFAQNLGRVRDLTFSPEGILLASVPSEGKVIAIRDKNSVTGVLTGLNNPHGIAFNNGKLFVAEERRLSRYNWDGQKLTASLDKVLFGLPAGGNHITRSLIFDSNNNLYISIGSTCNVCNEANPWRGAVIITNPEGENPGVFATGLRNSVFLTTNPQTGEIWATEMGRDYLGDDLPPDEINIIKEGKNYGWPNCYGDKVPDTNFDPADSGTVCNSTGPPVYKIRAHSAPLGLVFIDSEQFPAMWQGDLLVALHGSWNRSSPVGYKIVRLEVSGNQITGEADFITGFLQDSQAISRPVDLIFDQNGNLYISDDKAGKIYILSRKN